MNDQLWSRRWTRLVLLGAVVVAAMGVASSSAEAADRNGCVPNEGFATKAVVGKTRIFAPKRYAAALFLCRPGKPTYALLTRYQLTDGSGSYDSAKVTRRAGHFIAFSTTDEENSAVDETLIDAVEYKEIGLGRQQWSSDSSFGEFSAGGYAAFTNFRLSDRSTSVLGPDPNGPGPIVLDPGPEVRDLTVEGDTAHWMNGLEPRQAILSPPTFHSLPASMRVTPGFLRRISPVFTGVPREPKN